MVQTDRKKRKKKDRNGGPSKVSSTADGAQVYDYLADDPKQEKKVADPLGDPLADMSMDEGSESMDGGPAPVTPKAVGVEVDAIPGEPEHVDPNEIFDSEGKAIRWRTEEDRLLEAKYPVMNADQEAAVGSAVDQLNHLFDEMNQFRVEDMENKHEEHEAAIAAWPTVMSDVADMVDGGIAPEARKQQVSDNAKAEARDKFTKNDPVYGEHIDEVGFGDKRDYGSYKGDFKHVGYEKEPRIGKDSPERAVQVEAWKADGDKASDRTMAIEKEGNTPVKTHARFEDETGRGLYVAIAGFDNTPPHVDLDRLYEGFTYEYLPQKTKARKMKKGPSGRGVTDKSLGDILFRGGGHFRKAKKPGKRKFRRVKTYFVETSPGKVKAIDKKAYESKLKRNEVQLKQLYAFYAKRQQFIDTYKKHLDDPSILDGLQTMPTPAEDLAERDLEKSERGAVMPKNFSPEAKAQATEFFDKSYKMQDKAADAREKGKERKADRIDKKHAKWVDPDGYKAEKAEEKAEAKEEKKQAKAEAKAQKADAKADAASAKSDKPSAEVSEKKKAKAEKKKAKAEKKAEKKKTKKKKKGVFGKSQGVDRKVRERF